MSLRSWGTPQATPWPQLEDLRSLSLPAALGPAGGTTKGDLTRAHAPMQGGAPECDNLKECYTRWTLQHGFWRHTMLAWVSKVLTVKTDQRWKIFALLCTTGSMILLCHRSTCDVTGAHVHLGGINTPSESMHAVSCTGGGHVGPKRNIERFDNMQLHISHTPQSLAHKAIRTQRSAVPSGTFTLQAALDVMLPTVDGAGSAGIS